MLLENISEFIQSLESSRLNPNEICRALALSAFKNLDPRSVLIAELDDCGCIQIKGGFGFADLEDRSWTSIPMTKKLPITDAVLNNKIVIIGSDLKEWDEDYPDVREYDDTKSDWETMAVIPTYRNLLPSGAIIFFSKSHIDPTLEVDYFFRAVRQIVSLAQAIRPAEKVAPEPGVLQRKDPLSSRQMAILKMITEEMNNKEIAQILTYSESTIKQETIRIYEKLGVTNRHEASKKYKELQ
jgi:DNA-binding CsgD family transcriptional regulator